MYVCDLHRLVFLAQPRTASRAVAQWLCNEMGARKHRPTTGVSPVFLSHHGMDPIALEQFRDQGYRIVTHVRNHWDVLVSWWYADDQSKPFDKHIASWLGPRLWAQPHRLYWKLQPVADVVIKWEELDQAWSDLLGEPVSIPIFDASPRKKPYADEYTPELAQQVGEWYKDEIDLYGYSFAPATHTETENGPLLG